MTDLVPVLALMMLVANLVLSFGFYGGFYDGFLWWLGSGLQFRSMGGQDQ